MNSELFKQLYMWAVIALAAVAIAHVLKGKSGHPAKGSTPTPAQLVNPTWWTPGPVVSPQAAARKNHMSLGF